MRCWRAKETANSHLCLCALQKQTEWTHRPRPNNIFQRRWFCFRFVASEPFCWVNRMGGWTRWPLALKVRPGLEGVMWKWAGRERWIKRGTKKQRQCGVVRLETMSQAGKQVKCSCKLNKGTLDWRSLRQPHTVHRKHMDSSWILLSQRCRLYWSALIKRWYITVSHFEYWLQLYVKNVLCAKNAR